MANSTVPYTAYTEAVVGSGHPTLADVDNRPLKYVLSQTGIDADLGFGVAKSIIFSGASLAVNQDYDIRWNDANHFTRFMGASTGGTGGQVRVFGRGMTAAYDVDLLTPNASAAETFRLGIVGGVDWAQLDIRNVSNVNTNASGGYLKFTEGFRADHTITTAPDAATTVSGFKTNSGINCTDGINALLVKRADFYSTMLFGGTSGTPVAAIGSAWSFGSSITVNGGGSQLNEIACYFGGILAANGTQFRAWFTDYSVQGPTTAVQMNLVGGVTMCINNYFNGAMASQGLSGCFEAVTRPGQGAGGNVGEWLGKTTYAMDYGFLVTGWAGASGAKTPGFTVGLQIGGPGGPWNSALNGVGGPDTDAVSIISTGIAMRDIQLDGVVFSNPNLATANVLRVTGGTWATGISLSGGTFTTALVTGAGVVQVGDRMGIGTGANAAVALFITNGLSMALTGVTQRGIFSDFAGTSGATSNIRAVEIRAQTAAAAFTTINLAGLFIDPPVIGGGSTATNVYGIDIGAQTGGGTNYAIRTSTGLVQFGDQVQSTKRIYSALVSLGTGSNFTPDASAGNSFTATLNAAATFNAPTSVATGERILITIIQNGTGGFAVTWNAVFKVTWSDTGNTANKRSSVAFVYDGTSWNQDGAQSPYV